MSQAFISYHRAQRKLARLIAHRIAADGHSVWWDRGERPGDNWSEAVSTALANSACVVVIWSRQAATSPWVMGEATAGYGRGVLVSVQSDGTPPPSPFHKGPAIDMRDWEGAGDDVAWIRLREPVRAKLEASERATVIEADVLPPPRPMQSPLQPPPRARVAYTSTPLPPPPSYEPRRGGGAVSVMTLLLLGGAAAAGWVYRDRINEEALRLRAAWTPPATEVAEIPRLPTMPAAERAAPAATAPAPAAPDALAPAETAPDALPPAAKPAPLPAPEMTRTMEDWRDNYTPPPVLRTLPASSPAPAPKAPPVAAFSDIPPLPPAPPPAFRLNRVEIVEGRFIDLDPPGATRQTDLWFSLDRSGNGVFLGVANGARLRLVGARRATPAACADTLLRRTPIAERDLTRDRGLCIRSSAGTVTAWRIEGVQKGAQGDVLRLSAVSS